MRSSIVSRSLSTISIVVPLCLISSCSEPTTINGEQADADLVAHGAYVANAVAGCFHCHSPEAENPGALTYPLSGFISEGFVTPNITQDMETGIGSWSDAQIESALRNGKRPDGSEIHPVMPWKSYASLTSDDMTAVLAWLRTQTPVSSVIPRDFEFPFPRENFVDPPDDFVPGEKTATTRRGAYLVTVAHCLRCHTPVGEKGIDYANQLGAGGNTFGPPDAPVVSVNLTSHEDSAIAQYSDDEVMSIIRTGKRPDGSALAPIMGARPDINDNDLAAIVAFLRTLPALPYPDGPQ